MATTVTKTRTNYFAVKDKEAFADLVEKMATDDHKAFMFDNTKDEVGFAADGTIFGIDFREISEEMINQLKSELLIENRNDIEAFTGKSVEGWEKDAVEKLLDEVIGKKSKAELIKDLEYYIGLPELEPDEMETEMIHQIQDIIEPGHACIIMSISYENLKIITSNALIITNDKIETIILGDAALELAKTMLGNNDYSPDMIY